MYYVPTQYLQSMPENDQVQSLPTVSVNGNGRWMCVMSPGIGLETVDDRATDASIPFPRTPRERQDALGWVVSFIFHVKPGLHILRKRTETEAKDMTHLHCTATADNAIHVRN